MSDEIKSAYELAMERLEKEQGKLKPLTDDQKERIAQIEGRMKSKLAELDIMWERKMTEAHQSGDPEVIRKADEDRAAEIRKIRSDAEEAKEAVHNEK